MGKHPTLAFPSIRQMKEKWPVASGQWPMLRFPFLFLLKVHLIPSSITSLFPSDNTTKQKKNPFRYKNQDKLWL